MKKNLMFIVVFCCSLLGVCYADLAGYEIENYQADFELTQKGILKVEETIDVYFSQPRHGIYRDIPLRYPKSDYILTTPIDEVKISGYQFTTSENGDDYRIKIWSPDFKVVGLQSYPIRYEVRGAVRNFTGYQELYWNMLGNNRNTSIKNFNFSLTLPSDLQLVPETEFYAVWGFAGSKNRLKLEKKGNKILNAEALSLAPHEAVTIAVKFPENYVSVEEFKEELLEYLPSIVSSEHSPSQTVSSPIVPSYQKTSLLHQYLPFVLMGVLFLIWFILSLPIVWKGIKNFYFIVTKNRFSWRDVIFYTPPRWFTPADLATIYAKGPTYNSMFATLYDRYGKGIISLEHDIHGKFLSFSKKSRDNTNFSEFEKELWRLLGFKKHSTLSLYKLSRKQDELKKSAILLFDTLKSLLYTERSIEKYGSSTELKKNFSVSDIVIWVFLSILFSLLIILLTVFGVLPIFVAFIFFYFALIFWGKFSSSFALEYSPLGQEIYEQVLWFRKYLWSVEKEKLDTLLQLDPLYFEKILPYAIALDMGTKWIKKCKAVLEANQFISDTTRDISLLENAYSQIQSTCNTFLTSSESSSSRSFSSSNFGSDSGFDSDGGSSGGGGG